MTDKAKIEKRSSDSSKSLSQRKLLNALRKGENEMRRLSYYNYSQADSTSYMSEPSTFAFENKPYLPKEKDESAENFNFRVLYKTSLYAGTSKSINDINDRIFSQAIKFESDDEAFKEMVLNNFDGAGTGINEFSKRWNKDGLWAGCAFLLVNFNDGQRNDYNMPNVVRINADDVLDLSKDTSGNIEVFKYTFTYQERVDEFESVNVKCVDILFYNENGIPAMSRYKCFDDGDYTVDFERQELDIDVLPIVELYPESDTESLLCDRPYQNMADKNLTHWIFKSNYMNLVDVASRAFIFGSGFTADSIPEDENGKKKLKFGIKTMHLNKNKDAKMEWVQADSNSADMIKTMLDDLEEEMKMLGSEFLETKAIMTATEVKYSTSDTNNRAQNFAFNLEKSLNKAIELMLKWRGREDEEFILEVNKNIGLTKEEEIFEKVNLLNDKNIVSDKEVREVAQKVGYLTHEKTEEDFVEDLENEGKTLSNRNLLISENEEVNDEEVDEE